MNFGEALSLLKEGRCVARLDWNGPGMWLFFVNARADANMSVSGKMLRDLPWIGIKTADNGFVPWVASQTDLLAEDWTVL